MCVLPCSEDFDQADGRPTYTMEIHRTYTVTTKMKARTPRSLLGLREAGEVSVAREASEAR